MGGKGGATPSNNQMVQFEQQQAADARQKENIRQARLETGKAKIDQIFGGTPQWGYKQSQLDLTGMADPTRADATSGAVSDPTGGLTWRRSTKDPSTFAFGDGSATVPGTAGYGGTSGGGALDLLDSQGNVIASGADWNSLAQGTKGWAYNMRYDTGQIDPNNPGFNDTFYNNYRQKNLDYAMPQLSHQYDLAKAQAWGQLGNAGIARSSAAAKAMKELALQNTNQGTAIANSADQQTAQLRNSIASEQQTALNQLYSTEDPDVAATGAINMAGNSRVATPVNASLGDLFKPLVIGATSAFNTYNNLSNAGYGFNSVMQPRSATGTGAQQINQG